MTSVQAQLPARFVLTDAARGPSPLQQLAKLTPTDALIFRHYEMARDDRRELAHTLRQRSKAQGVRLLIAGDSRLAFEVAADGIHLSSWMLKRGDVWARRKKAGWITTAAAHGEAELRAAWQADADAALVSPVFPTKSHPGAQTLGVVRFARMAGAAKIPVYALGGVIHTSYRRLADVPNMVGWATVSAV